MRLILIILIILLNQSVLISSHVMGGFISYRHISNDSYLIQLTLIKDNNLSTTGFDNQAVIGVFENSGDYPLVQELFLDLSDASLVDMPLSSDQPCLINFTQPITIANYSDTIQLANNNLGYILSYQRCCTSELTNLPFTQGFTISTSIGAQSLAVQNSSCLFDSFSNLLMCSNSPVNIDFSVFDSDSDSISYRFCSAFQGASLDNPAPSPPTSPPYTPIELDINYDFTHPFGLQSNLSLDSINGMFVGIGPEPGYYLLSICAEEMRDNLVIGSTMGTFVIACVFCEFSSDSDNNGICDNLEVVGCNDSIACNYNAQVNVPDNQLYCIYPGCTDPAASNYSALAGCDDGSCLYLIGCMDSTACNFDATAIVDDVCFYPGCTDPLACNYNWNAGCEDGSCSYILGEINGNQLIYLLEENTFSFPCDSGCIYQWTVTTLAGTEIPAGFILGGSNDCQAEIAWGATSGLAQVQLSVQCDSDCSVILNYPIQIGLGEQNELLQDLLVYPNPIQNVLTLEHIIPGEIEMISITDITGRCFFTSQVNQQKINIDCSNWPMGIYSLLIHKNGMNSLQKIIKM
jgi:hypothetical protein